MADQATTFPIDQLQPNPLQPRGVITPDSLADLVDSIKIHGIIEPLVIAHTPAGYQIIAGERRWRAARIAGLSSVPVLIKETTPQGMLEMAIIENVQRTDLNPVDRAKSFDRLMTEFNLSNQEVANRIGKSPAYISNSLRLLQLPDALKDGLISGVISEGHARALSAIPDTATMIEAYKIILRENGSVRRAEALARRYKNKLTYEKASKAIPQPDIKDDEIDLMSQRLTTSLGNNATVKIRRSRIETAIHIALKGDPLTTESQISRIYKSITGQDFHPPVDSQSPEDLD